MQKFSSIKKLIRKADVILIALILIVGIGLAVAQGVSFASTYDHEATVKITIGGELYGSYPLDKTATIRVDNNYDNVVSIQKGADGQMQVFMQSADCPDKDCLRHAPIGLGGQTIVCLPARLVVEVVGPASSAGTDGDQVDGYTY
jgi:hypothetical protein